MRYLIFIGILFLVVKVNAQQLQSYIEEAEKNNPDIKAALLNYNIAEEKIKEGNWLPNTQISAGYFVSEPETRTGAQRARFSISQMLPWFGTINARANYASSMAEAEYINIIIAKRELALSVSKSYYELSALKAKEAILDSNIQLLQTYERLALTSVEVGKASAVDVLKLKIRQNEIQQQKEVLEQEYLAEEAAFNNFNYRDKTNPLEVFSNFDIPQEDPVFSSEGLSLNPELTKYDKLFESINQSELVNQKEGLPMIGLGLDYVPVSERPEMNFSDNGKDIIMPMVSVTIPIFNNRYNSITRQNDLRNKEIQAQKENRLNRLKTVLEQAVRNRNKARIQYNTQQKNLQQAKDAEEILVKNYETGTITFNDVLDIQELQLKFEMSTIESVKMYYTQSAIINYLIN